MRIGIIGIGNMGLAMALRLLETGHAVVVHDLRPEAEAAAAAQGAIPADSPRALAERCDVVLVAVVDAAQVEQVLFGDNGTTGATGVGDANSVIHANPRPALVALCPTIAPEDVVAAAARLATAGIATLDAPMSGGPGRARDGSMSLMLAGPPELLATHAGWLADLAAHRTEVGPRLGDAARTKLVNNLLAAANLAAAAEAMALARRIGLDAERTLDLIDHSSGQSWIGHDRMARRLAGDTAPQAHMRLLAKDSRLALAMAEQVGLKVAVGAAAAARFQAACAAGLAAEDDGALLEFCEQPPATAQQR